jgi:hypothetical protein
MLHEAFGGHSLSWTVVFEWHSHFKAGWVSVEADERSGWPSTSKMTENVEKIRKFAYEDCWQQSMSSQPLLGSVMKFARLNRKSEHAPHCREVCSPTLDKWRKAVVRKRFMSYRRRLTRTQLFCLGL